MISVILFVLSLKAAFHPIDVAVFRLNNAFRISLEDLGGVDSAAAPDVTYDNHHPNKLFVPIDRDFEFAANTQYAFYKFCGFLREDCEKRNIKWHLRQFINQQIDLFSFKGASQKTHAPNGYPKSRAFPMVLDFNFWFKARKDASFAAFQNNNLGFQSLEIQPRALI